MELTATADLTGSTYYYDPPAKDSKETIRLSKVEEEKINKKFSDEDPNRQ